MLHQNTLHETMHEWTRCHDEAANHQLPIAVASWVIQIVSAYESSSLMQYLMQIHCSTSSVILNGMAIQYTYSINRIYHPHWLVQWSRHCSRMHIPVHSPLLPGYIDVSQTVLIKLTMVGLFPDRPCIFLLHTSHAPRMKPSPYSWLPAISNTENC